MPAIKKMQVKDALFQALVESSDGTLTLEYLNETLSNSSISKEYSGTSVKSESVPRRVSAFRMFQKHFKDTDSEDKPKWDDYKKSNPDMVKQFQEEADAENKANGLSPDAIKSQKKLKKQQTKEDIINKTKKLEEQLKQLTLDKERITREEEMKDSPGVSMEVNVSPAKTDTSDEIFDKMDKNGDGVVSREEFNTFNEKKNDTNSENDEVNSETDEVKSETDEVKSETDEVKSETDEVKSETDEVKSETDEDEKSIVVDEDKPKFHGKNPNTALANFKEFCKNELGLDSKSSIPTDDLKELKDKYSFNTRQKDPDAPWVDYIKNNMII